MPADLRDVDPRELRVLPSRYAGADPIKLARQIAKFGASTTGMPPLWVCEATDGVLVIYNGVTRATRIAKLAPGTLVRVEVIARLRRAFGKDPATMIQPLQQTLLRGLGEVCELSPDVRFGQMLDFLGFLAQDATDRPLAEIEDDELLRVIENHRANLLKRQASPSEPRA